MIYPACAFLCKHRGGIAIALIALLNAASCGVSGQSKNIAKDCPYTMTPRPTYALTTDAGDDRQLTDGVYSSWNPIWRQQSTVGWENASPVTIVIDLRSVQSIAGVTYSTAAGTAGVEWPRSIFALVSDDGRRYFPVADLAAGGSGNTPPAAGYAHFRFAAQNLVTHGRYVALLVDQNGPYTFCDEIEVLAGGQEALRSPLSGEATTDLQDFFGKARTRGSITRRLSMDLDSARSALAASSIAVAERQQLSSELDRLAAAVPSTPPPDVNTFTTVLPLNDVDAAIFAVHGAIAHANGRPELTAWAVNPWDFVRPLDKAPSSPAREQVVIAAMNGETRSGAINLANSTSHSMTAALTIAGLPPDASRDLRLSEVVWTDSRDLIPVADALVPLSGTKPAVELPAGMTRQIWITFSPNGRAAGAYRGSIDAAADAHAVVRVPFEANVLPGTFPQRPTLHVGGWDYTNQTNIHGLTPDNRTPLIEQLRALNVDSPWATSAVIPSGRYDAAGRLVDPPPTAPFDRWTADWPDASGYYIFVNAADSFGGAGISENPRFRTAVGQWITFWTRHAGTRGITSSRLALLLVDEPHTPAQHNRIVEWARAIKAAEPGIRIWEDPNDADPAQANPASMDAADILALKRSLIARHGAAFVDFYRRRAAKGQELGVYGTDGPVRLLDPYSYYRLQAWVCADLGAKSSSFWSFSDDGGGHSWNEYATGRNVYSPWFLSRDRVTTSKHSEAIREGVEDFEYLTLLRDRVAALQRSDPHRPGLAHAVDVLSTATKTVLQSPGADDERWTAGKDRSVAERVRLSIAEAIESLREAARPPAHDP